MSVSRRSVLKAGVAAGAAALASPWTSVADAQQKLAPTTTRVRYKATSPQGKAMLVKYAKAVALMSDASKYPPGDPRSWNFQWYTHWVPGPQSPWSAVAQAKAAMIDKVYAGLPPTDPNRLLAQAMWDDCQAHGQIPADPNFFQEFYFCVWHRYYVYYFEEIIRGVLQDNTFTLPYWDYLSGNVSDLSIPPEFRDTNSPLFRQNRNPWVNQGQRIDLQNPGSLNLDCFNETFYIDTPDGSQGFCPILDGNPHGLVHVYTGNSTNMGRIPFAAGDPVFWLHHCNIDRLWESWNRLPGRVNPAWPNRQFPFANGQGKAQSVLPAGADRVAKLNYTYDSYYRPPTVPPAPPTNLTLAAPVRLTRANAAEPVTLGSDRARVALTPATSAAPFGAAPSTDAVFAVSSQAKRLYLVLGGISAPDTAASTYNVYLNLPEGSTAAGADDPHYVGTLHFFGASGHADHAPGGGHRTVFNVTTKVRALRASGALTGAPSVTLVRRGEEEGEKPVVSQIVLVEA